LKSPDFDTITQYARTIEKLLKSSEADTSVESPIFPSNKPATRETITCFKCQNTGHIAKECPKKSLETQRVQNKLYCVICGKTNHLAIKCFQWKNSKNLMQNFRKLHSINHNALNIAQTGINLITLLLSVDV
jgi:hypothetical protein